jgi:hypothetical protein
MPPVPRSSPAGKLTPPDASLRRVARISLLRAMSCISTPGMARAVAKERTKTCSPSDPVKLVSPMSESITHCAAVASQRQAPLSGLAASVASSR